MIGAILGSVTGFAGSVLPAVMEHFTAKARAKERLTQKKMELELLKENADINLKMFREQASDKEHQRLIDHDIAISKSTGIIGALQKSVRPVITYMFFMLFVAVEAIAIYALISQGADAETIKETIWTEETQTIFAAIISFWFGSRAIEKRRK